MEIQASDITRVYSGRPGCGCGCRGKYWTDERNIRRIVKIMNDRQDEVQQIDGIYAIEDDRRYYWAYTTGA